MQGYKKRGNRTASGRLKNEVSCIVLNSFEFFMEVLWNSNKKGVTIDQRQKDSYQKMRILVTSARRK